MNWTASPRPHQSEIRGAASAIVALPLEVVAQIKSSATITNLAFAILGLVQNSLDARASKITIDVDFKRGGCVVEDNGLGILPTEFDENGGLGKIYRRTCCTRNSTNKLIGIRYLQVQNFRGKLWMQRHLFVLFGIALFTEHYVSSS